ncbi:MAG: hypothetical protein LBU06_07255, partial [Desulfovibrio sp.]|nr:hypothetical protein [Desulfovibrio sp.]
MANEYSIQNAPSENSGPKNSASALADAFEYISNAFANYPLIPPAFFAVTAPGSGGNAPSLGEKPKEGQHEPCKCPLKLHVTVKTRLGDNL